MYMRVDSSEYRIRDQDRDGRKSHIVIIIIILLIFICLGYLTWLLYGYYKANMIYSSVAEDFVVEYDMKSKREPEEDVDDGFPEIDIDIDGLLGANPDFLCWIYYGDGRVDYPVVKEREDDVNGWMHRAFDGTKSSSGTVFMPYDADEGFHDMNTFLYGHNMANGTMFGSMKFVYRDPKANYNDPYFYVWTKDHEKIKYRIVAMYVVNKNSSMYAIPMTDDSYREYFGMMMQKGDMSGFISLTKAEEEAVENISPIVTLSTCYGYAGTSNRLLVQGIETDRRPYVRNNVE